MKPNNLMCREEKGKNKERKRVNMLMHVSFGESVRVDKNSSLRRRERRVRESNNCNQ